MSVRKLEFAVNIDGITPKNEVFAGSSGDKSATALHFNLSDSLSELVGKQNVFFRFDGYDAEGNVLRGDSAPLLSNNLIYTLPEPITRCGGKICVYLVITQTNDRGTQMELYSFPARMHLNSLPQGGEADKKEYESLTSLAESAKNSADSAKADAVKAEESATLADGAKIKSAEINADSELVLIYKDGSSVNFGNVKGDKGDKGDNGKDGKDGKDAVTDQSYNPESENAQSGKAVKEALQKSEKNYMSKWAEVNNTASRYPVIQLPPGDVDAVTFRVGEQGNGNHADLSLFKGSFVISLNSGGNSGSLFGGFDDNGKMYLNGIGTPSDTAEESVVVNKGYVDAKIGAISKTEEPTVSDIPLPVETLQAFYQFYYYSSVVKAVEDVNSSAVGANADATKETAEAGVYLKGSGEAVVVLLKDIEISTAFTSGSADAFDVAEGYTFDVTHNCGLAVSKDMTLNLGGHKLSFSGLKRGINASEKYPSNITIDGRLSGSEISIENQTAMAYCLYAGGSNWNINGGAYYANAKLVKRTATCFMSNSTATENKAVFNIKNCYMESRNESGTSRGITNYGTLNLYNTTIFTDARAGSTSASYGVSNGIVNYGTAHINNCCSYGTHCGVQLSEGSNTYIKGGVYEGVNHGGLYCLQGAEGEAYVEDATVKQCNYKGTFADYVPIRSGEVGGGLYITGSNATSFGTTVYLNNCNIICELSGISNPHAIVLSGAHGGAYNRLFVSNTSLPDNALVRIDEDSLGKLFIGKGCNFDIDDVVMLNPINGTHFTVGVFTVVLSTEEIYSHA